MKNTGKEYEDFVGNLQQALLDFEEFTKQKNILVEKNKIIRDRNGIDREFDLYWEYELGGVTYKTVIECRDYGTTISIGHIDGLVGKLLDLPGLKPVFATKKGYQEGALTKAKQHNIDLLIVREQNDADWKDECGFHLLKGATVDFHINKPASITNFLPEIDLKWVHEKEIDFEYIKTIKLCGKTSEIIIDNISNNEKYTLLELENKLTTLQEDKPGKYEFVQKLDEAYLIHNDVSYKILSLRVEYIIPEPEIITETFDFTQELIGVIEYLHKGKKLKIFRNGNIHEHKLNTDD